MMYIIDNFKTKLKPNALNNRGQGLTEFILMLLIVVGIIVGGVYQFNDAFKQYADNYFGEYLACLLETGELPALGAKGGGAADLCNESFEDFSMANGRPKVATSPTSPNTGGSGPGGNTPKSTTVDAGEAAQQSGTSFSVSSGTASADGGGANNVFRTNTPKGPGLAVAGAGVNKSKLYTGDTKSTSASWGLESSKDDKKKNGFNDYGSYYDGDPDEQKRERGIMAVGTASSKADDKKNKDKLLKVRKRQINADVEQDLEGFTFGKFLRYLFIIAILIALLIFFGSQAMQIGKSME